MNPSDEALCLMSSHLAASIGRRNSAMTIPTLEECTPKRENPTRNVVQMAMYWSVGVREGAVRMRRSGRRRMRKGMMNI